MELEKQVTSLEPSEKLKELGVTQKSLWMWRKYSLCDEPKLYLRPQEGTELSVLSGNIEYEYAAFTISELLEILKKHILCFELYCPDEGKWMAQTKTHECECKKCKVKLKKDPEYLAVNWEVTESKLPLEALSKMLIHLIENKLI